VHVCVRERERMYIDCIIYVYWVVYIDRAGICCWYPSVKNGANVHLAGHYLSPDAPLGYG